MPDTSRIAALDLIRGVAVLGILAVNIAAFAGPPLAVYTPSAVHAASPADGAAFAFMLVVFEGKMRALFALLFGASMELFVSRADDAGRPGQTLQLRRLLWLAVFGYLHWLLLWWGDILFTYAIVGMAALALRQMRAPTMLALALLLFTAWQISGLLEQLPLALAEARRAAGTASGLELAAVAQAHTDAIASAAQYLGAMHEGFLAQIAGKLRDDRFGPLRAVSVEFGEVLPYMLLGGLLLRSGFFSGGWRPARRGAPAIAGLGLGGAVTVGFTGWAWRHGYPYAAMRLAIDHALGFAHLAMALGYAALLVRCAGPILRSGLGQRIAAAGRMAFSNYLGTTVVMTAIFCGWGSGLGGQVGAARQAAFVVLGWTLMLGWSRPWLAHYRQGPLEWLWRSLTFGHPETLRKW